MLFWKIDRSGFSCATASFSTNLVSKRCIPQVEVEVCLGCKIDSESILWSIIDSESLRECPPKIDSCRDSITTRSLISHLSLCHARETMMDDGPSHSKSRLPPKPWHLPTSDARRPEKTHPPCDIRRKYATNASALRREHLPTRSIVRAS